MGHEEQFSPPTLSDRYVIRQETSAGTHGNGRDAQIPDLRLWRHTPRGLAREASNFDLPAQLHDPVRGNAEELGRIQARLLKKMNNRSPHARKTSSSGPHQRANASLR